MKDFFKRVKLDFIISSLLCIALGVTFIVWKAAVVDVLGAVLSVGLLVVGLIYLCGFFFQMTENWLNIVIGIVLVALGIWFLIDPSKILSLIPIVLGIVLLFHGIRAMWESVNAKKYGLKSWGAGFVMAILSIAGGVVCIVFAADIVESFAIVVGLILIYNGLSNIWIACSASHARKQFEKNAAVIEAEFIEDKEV